VESETRLKSLASPAPDHRATQAHHVHVHGHAARHWSALASNARARLFRVSLAIAVLWLAVGWALGVGTP
jgi:hypothetical protein